MVTHVACYNAELTSLSINHIVNCNTQFNSYAIAELAAEQAGISSRKYKSYCNLKPKRCKVIQRGCSVLLPSGSNKMKDNNQRDL